VANSSAPVELDCQGLALSCTGYGSMAACAPAHVHLPGLLSTALHLLHRLLKRLRSMLHLWAAQHLYRRRQAGGPVGLTPACRNQSVTRDTSMKAASVLGVEHGAWHWRNLQHGMRWEGMGTQVHSCASIPAGIINTRRAVGPV
jgi:hypothetical protein